MMESADSSTGSQHPHLPPGFRFHPTDEELVVHYLKRKAALVPLPVTIIAEIDLYKFDPWELPSKAVFGEQEWYFFTPRDRKYPNGARPNRAATSGYWKATGTDKPILTSNGTQKIGVKKALVFYGGKPPKGIKTNWIMHEYRLVNNSSGTKPPPGTDPGSKKGSLRLDDWVLCRIYKKNNSSRPMEREKEDLMDDHDIQLSKLVSASGASNYNNYVALPLLQHEENLFEGILTMQQNMSSISHTNINLASSSTNTGMSMASLSPLAKRTLPTQYWNEPPEKQFQDSDGNSSSFVSLLGGQINPTGAAAFQPNMLVGSLGEGVVRHPYQLPSMNWNL